MPTKAFREFGRKIFSMFEKYPLTMNSIVGGTVYGLGELVVQSQNKNFKDIPWKRVSDVGALGVLENGILMNYWYMLLTKTVGSGISTKVVLTKCALDQIFFASQADGIFLLVCAVQQADKLPAAMAEVERTFLTTWINDCSVWPLVNFIAFSWVPPCLQPTFMSSIQFFWQIYLSSVSSNAEAAEEMEKKMSDDDYLLGLFDELDKDKSGFIDANEFHHYFLENGIKHEMADIVKMIAEADAEGESDGKVSPKEFMIIVRAQAKQPTTSALWKVVREKAMSPTALHKGAQAARKRLEAFKAKEAQDDAKGAHTRDTKGAKGTQEDTTAASTSSISSMIHDASEAFAHTTEEILVALKEEAEKELTDKEWQESRRAAINNASMGLTLLMAAAVIRRLVFKI